MLRAATGRCPTCSKEAAMSRSSLPCRQDAGNSLLATTRSEISSVEASERLRRLAGLIASGEASLPAHLATLELQTVLVEVACLRRERLIRLVARAIAADLRGAREPA